MNILIWHICIKNYFLITEKELWYFHRTLNRKRNHRWEHRKRFSKAHKKRILCCKINNFKNTANLEWKKKIKKSYLDEITLANEKTHCCWFVANPCKFTFTEEILNGKLDFLGSAYFAVVLRPKSHDMGVFELNLMLRELF